MRNFRQALASPHPGRFFHDPVATFACVRFEGDVDMAKAPRFVLALVGALLISGCALRSVHVAQLKDQPARYYNKSVSVNGVVTRSWGLPLVPFQFYSVDDGTGQITVIGHQGRVPPTGSRVNVKGRVQELAAFGGQSLGLHIDEEKRKIKY
ncbi:MAG TPA: OB-fold nucleic acid binding domain-containing protein [Vicinamibacterales bacterium]|jgi:hypothetical protein